MRKYFGTIEHNTTGRPVPSASVAVLTGALTPTSIFSDDGTTPTDNPVITDTNGYFEFYVADGVYVLQISYNGSVRKTITDVEISESGTADVGALSLRVDDLEAFDATMGTIATQDADAVAITGGDIAGITDLAVADGGTGASTADAALTNLGVSTFAKTILDDTDAATARTTLGVVLAAPVTTQSGTSYTAVLGDANGYIQFTNGSAVAFTIPPNSDVAFPVDTVISIEQNNSGVITVTPGAGVTINSRDALVASAGQYAVAQVKKVATDIWTLIGDVA